MKKTQDDEGGFNIEEFWPFLLKGKTTQERGKSRNARNGIMKTDASHSRGLISHHALYSSGHLVFLFFLVYKLCIRRYLGLLGSRH